MNYFDFTEWAGLQELHFRLEWTDQPQPKITRLKWLPKPSEIPNAYDLQTVPYGPACFIKELRVFFKLGEPLLPTPWELMELEELSDFQKKVYQYTSTIPCGETRTYAWLAQKVGKPFAARAVGQALRRNPFMLIVPCHRVVSERGLGGFMGADDPSDLRIKIKTYLLNWEQHYRNPPFLFARAELRPPF